MNAYPNVKVTFWKKSLQLFESDNFENWFGVGTFYRPCNFSLCRVGLAKARPLGNTLEGEVAAGRGARGAQAARAQQPLRAALSHCPTNISVARPVDPQSLLQYRSSAR